MSSLKDWLKRIPGFRRLAWKWHVLRDELATRFWNRTTETITPLGFKLVSGAHPAYAQMRNGTFEPDETAAILTGIQSSDLFVDIGANLGYYSLLALKHGVRVVACEPQIKNLNCLRANIVANSFSGIEVHPLALASSPGTLTLYGSSGPSASLLSGWAGYSPSYQQIVDVSTLDLILGGKAAGERLFVKVDVEGAEYGVLQGGTLVLRREPRPQWLVEICLREFHPGGNPHYRDTFEMFLSNGYRAFLPNGKEVTRDDITRWEQAGVTDHGGFNYVFK